MAQQTGIIKLKGSIGGITFYKLKDGYIAREKAVLSRERIANDPNFQRMRENSAEFGRAGKAVKVLRISLKTLLQNTADNKMFNRLTKEMIKVIHGDVYSARGQRHVTEGTLALLEGFDFNLNRSFSTAFYAPFTATIDRRAGMLTVDIPPYVPTQMVLAPSGATHYKIISSGVEINFADETYSADTQSLAELPCTPISTVALTLVNMVTPNSTKPLFLALGIEFFQEVNGTLYALKNSGYNACCLIKVSGS
ncbi:hypothetical protein [Polluticaenibacter yanchengensis]|uniref:Uncharacterized protein n=1 Tax=Polluticaenibacter yanchengensis TaxID=3014562 RepID=A0ABT4UL06_9BACT|nr:hypothetical protein [Chitinophagaceae bacterium LY-5]